MRRIVSSPRRQQRHDLWPAASFDPDSIYVHDSGRVACGRHVGIEATYQPHEWGQIGFGAFHTTGDGLTLACETCYPSGICADYDPTKER